VETSIFLVLPTTTVNTDTPSGAATRTVGALALATRPMPAEQLAPVGFCKQALPLCKPYRLDQRWPQVCSMSRGLYFLNCSRITNRSVTWGAPRR